MDKKLGRREFFETAEFHIWAVIEVVNDEQDFYMDMPEVTTKIDTGDFESCVLWMRYNSIFGSDNVVDLTDDTIRSVHDTIYNAYLAGGDGKHTITEKLTRRIKRWLG